MAGRPVQKTANIPALKELVETGTGVLDIGPLIAYVMKNCECTFAEIGEVLGTTRQAAETAYKKAEQAL